jgi:hypothetical protein
MTDLSTSTTRAHQSTRTQIILALGDASIFIFFAAAGRAAHGLPPGDSPLLAVLGVAAPFAMSWYIVAFLLGVYHHTALNPLSRLLTRTLLAWIIACGLGLIVRSLLSQSPIIPAFALTTFSINAALLLGWRVSAGFIRARRMA